MVDNYFLNFKPKIKLRILFIYINLKKSKWTPKIQTPSSQYISLTTQVKFMIGYLLISIIYFIVYHYSVNVKIKLSGVPKHIESH